MSSLDPISVVRFVTVENNKIHVWKTEPIEQSEESSQKYIYWLNYKLYLIGTYSSDEFVNLFGVKQLPWSDRCCLRLNIDIRTVVGEPA